MSMDVRFSDITTLKRVKSGMSTDMMGEAATVNKDSSNTRRADVVNPAETRNVQTDTV